MLDVLPLLLPLPKTVYELYDVCVYVCVITVLISSSRAGELIECHQYHTTDHLGPSPHTKWWHPCLWGSLPGRGRTGRWGSGECHSHLCGADWPETRVHLHHLSEGLHSCWAQRGEKTDSSSSYYQHLSVACTCTQQQEEKNMKKKKKKNNVKRKVICHQL